MLPTSSAAGGPVLIDVRSDREFEQGRIEGALHVPLGDLQARIRDVVPDLQTPVVLYCASGGRSGLGCQLLQRMGYTTVTNAGGLLVAAAHLGRDICY